MPFPFPLPVISRPLIYLDHAATTPLRAEAFDAMLPWLRDEWGNASSLHAAGRRARVAVDAARETVARAVGCEPGDVVFTSGGTEADNAALNVLRVPAMRAAGRTALVTSAAEHEAVRRPAARLAADGHAVAVVAPTPSGAADAAAMVTAVAAPSPSGASPAVGLVSAMLVNNETGATSDVRALADAAHAAGAWMHTDAVQAPGVLPLNLSDLGADLVTLSAHKVGGPKGAGALVVRAGVPFDPFVAGGAQERGRRGGTENVAAIVGLASALRLAADEQPATAERLTGLRARLLDRLEDGLPGRFVVHTPLGASAPHILSVSFPPGARGPLDGQMLLAGLDLDGVAVSAGSACTSGALEPSHVLLAMGVERETAGATIRFSLGRETTADEIDAAAQALAHVVARVGG